MTSYEDNWQRYNELERQAQDARNQYEAARAAHGAAELGSVEWSQLGGMVSQRQQEAQTAEAALNSFKQEVQQTQPEQVQYLEMGVAPEAVKMADATELAVKAEPVIIESTISPDFLEGSGISVLEVAKESLAALKNAPDYYAGQLHQRTAEQIAQAPPPSLDLQIENAILDEVQKTDQAAFKQQELDKLALRHAEQTARQEMQLDKFMASQADKPAEVQARQAELAEKARQDLAEKQAREMQEKQAELERSREEARAAQELAKALEDSRSPR